MVFIFYDMKLQQRKKKLQCINLSYTAGHQKFELSGSQCDYKLFMEDGAELCDDHDILMGEIVGGQLLFIAKSWDDKYLHKEIVTSTVEPSQVAQTPKLASRAVTQVESETKVIMGTNVPEKTTNVDGKFADIAVLYIECTIFSSSLVSDNFMILLCAITLELKQKGDYKKN